MRLSGARRLALGASIGAICLILGVARGIGPAVHPASASQAPAYVMNGPDLLLNTGSQVALLGETSLANVYGGHKLDYQGHTVDVLLTVVSPTTLATLDAGVAHPELLRVSQARYTMQQLLELQQRIKGDRNALAQNGIHISGIGIGFGKVTIIVAETAAGVATTLQERYGADAVDVLLGQTYTTTATADRDGPPPLAGGMELDDIGNPSSVTNGYYYDCTAGFVAVKFINGQPFYQMITAGHCFGETQMVYHDVYGSGTVPLGQVNQTWWQWGSNCDCESADIRGGWTQASNTIITQSPYVHTVDYLDGTPQMGLPVCKSGVTTEQTCNFTVQDTNYTAYFVDSNGNTNMELDGVMRACCDSLDHGDSGGPVYHYYNPQAIYGEGILSGGGVTNGNFNGNMVYTFIQSVTARLGVEICTQNPSPTLGC